MKNYILSLLMVTLPLAMFAQNDAISTYFSKYQNDEDFTSVFISKKMFSMIAKIDPEDMDEDTRDVFNNLEGLRVLSTDFNGTSLFKESMNTLNANSYEVLMTVQDNDSDVQFLVKEGSGDRIKELLLLVGGVDGFTMISFIGNLDIDKLSKMSGDIEIGGLEHLKNLEKR